ncbi:tRNA nucleotidyltransferase/poly(A) polymerase family protein [Clostridium sp. DL1XJH146]
MDKYINKFNGMIEDFTECNGKFYAVGGYCRDKVMKMSSYINDVDIIYTGNVEQLINHIRKKGFNIYIIKKEASIYRVTDEDIIIDISPLKGNTIEEDLYNRDFSINSIAFDIIDNVFIDPYKGIEDINNKLLKRVNENSIAEDYVRILRAVRFTNQYSLQIEETLISEIKKQARNIFKAPKERLFIEIMKIIDKDFYGQAFYCLDRFEILKEIIPNLNELKKIGKCKYHVEDVFTHINMVYKNYKKLVSEEILFDGFSLELKEKQIAGFSVHNYIAFACFTHDVGKYECYKKDGNKISFIGHDVKGKEIVGNICVKLGFSNEGKKIVETLVGAHMYILGLYKNEIKDYKNSFYKFFKKYDGYIQYIIAVSYCDMLATKSLYDPEDQMENFEKFLVYIIDEYKLYEDIKVHKYLNGSDIIQYTNAIGKEIGEIINQLDKQTYFGHITSKNDAIDFLLRNSL